MARPTRSKRKAERTREREVVSTLAGAGSLGTPAAPVVKKAGTAAGQRRAGGNASGRRASARSAPGRRAEPFVATSTLASPVVKVGVSAVMILLVVYLVSLGR